MTRLLVDVSSVLWMSLLAGKDPEYGREVEFEGKKVHVNGWQFGYECAMGHLTSVLKELNLTPHEMILVVEGKMSKSRRKAFYEGYKAGRGRPPEAYDEFNRLKEEIVKAFRGVGAIAVSQDGVESDDVIAYLCGTLVEDIVILSNDGDLAVLLSDRISHMRNGKLLTENPYGPFSPRFITIYKALVGDPSDNLKGAPGFGKQAFMNLLVWAGEPGLAAIEGMIKRGTLEELTEDVAEFKALGKVVDGRESVTTSYNVAKLRPEWCNTLRQPLQWQPGMVEATKEERLREWGAQVRLVTATNYDAAVAFFKAHIDETPFVSLDLETTVPQESDEWLAGRKGVDVIASTIVGCGLTFGRNNQYGFYCSVDHKDTDNVTPDQLADLLELIPQDKMTIAHNAAGFELPVLYQAFGERWKSNGWRGFLPNMVDSRLAASYWDENQPSHGLKQLTKLLLGYEQTSYDEVTQGRKMNEMTAVETLSYGLDDVYTATGLWNFFSTIMQIEGTLDAFMRIEQYPMYLSALSFVNGTPISLARLRELKQKDEATYAECSKTLNEYLIQQGWAGTQCPHYAEALTSAQVKEVVQIILGQPLETAVRTISKMATLIEEIDHPDSALLAMFIRDNNLDQINDWVARRFDGTPEINVGSNKQLTTLLYETMGLPVRLRNKATDVMRAKGIREGNPRADDEAMAMAIKMGDASPEVAPVLKALTQMKSINTRMGLYWNPYPDMVHWMDRKLHPEVRQCATNTRRHTSSHPNIQQLDSEEGGVRSVIRPHHSDAVIVSLDLSGQEIRLLADMSRDENMMSAYMGENPKDLHSFTAAMILGIPYDEFRARYKSEDAEVATTANAARQVGKTTFFASSYGAMAPKIAESLGIAESKAQSYLDALDKAFPRVSVWKRETENIASQQGWVPLHGGTRRHLAPLLLSDDKWIAQKALRQASNARIQGAGGNQVRTVMSKIWASNLLDQYDFRFYWPVHDEIVVSVGRKDAVPVIKALHAFMCAQFLDVLPSASSIGIGTSFGSLIEIGEVADEKMIAETVAKVLDGEAIVA